MTTPAADVAVLVERLSPFDELESEHRADVLSWLPSTTDVFRRMPPRIPLKHPVAPPKPRSSAASHATSPGRCSPPSPPRQSRTRRQPPQPCQRRLDVPAPLRCLYAYFLLCDARDGSVLLVHHRRAGLWLPTGGHVEVGEDPADTVRREAPKELGLAPVFTNPAAHPVFITVTETTGSIAARHTDVSLWYLLSGSKDDDLHSDEREFIAVRWWGRTELAAADPSDFEPHLARFLAKVASHDTSLSEFGLT